MMFLLLFFLLRCDILVVGRAQSHMFIRKMGLSLFLTVLFCGGGATSKKKLSSPKKGADGKYRCPIDEFVFETKADFDRHFRKTHTAEAGLI